MPATGLKIVGTEACLPWCSISSSFQNSLKTSGYRVYEFLEFWCWNLVPFCQFSTWTLLLWSHAVVIAAVCGFALSCWNTQGLPWNRRCLEGSICCSKAFIYLSAFIVPSKTCKLPIPYAFMHTIPSEMLTFELNADNTLEGLPPLKPGGHGVCDFQQECQIWMRLTI